MAVKFLPKLTLTVKSVLSVGEVNFKNIFTKGQVIEFYPTGKTKPKSKSYNPDSQTIIFGRLDKETELCVTLRL